MFHSSKRKIAVSVLALTTILASTQSAFAALTIGATSVRSDGVYNVSGAAASVSEFADLSTTGNITIGKALTTGTLTLGKSDATGIVAVHGGTSAANTLFNNVTGGTIAIGVANTGGIAIGDGATAKAITIGSGAAVNAVTVGSTNTTSATTINAGTGNLNIGNDAVAKITTINIGAQATGQDLVAVGSAHASSTLTLEGGTDAGAILIGNGATAHGIQIGTGAAVNTVSVGSTNTTSTTTINSGTTTTGRVILAGSGQLDFNATAPAAPAATGGGTGTIAANSTDAVGQIGVDANGGNTALVLTFNKTYTVAPICVVSGADAGGAAAIGEAAGVIVTSAATTMTLTYTANVATAKTFNYHCFKTT